MRELGGLNDVISSNVLVFIFFYFEYVYIAFIIRVDKSCSFLTKCVGKQIAT